MGRESAPRTEAEALRDENLRLRAELENVRKRARAEALAAVRAANERLILALLPILDALDRAEAAIDLSRGNGGGTDAEALAEGFAHIARGLRSVLEGEGVTAFAPAAGERFDPLRHDAAERRETDAVEEGSVIEVLDRGYLLAGRLLRPARVVVAVAPAPEKRPAPASAPEAGGTAHA